MNNLNVISKLKWFILSFLLILFFGIIVFYFGKSSINIKSLSFITIVALLAGIGGAFTGSKFEAIVRAGIQERKEKRDSKTKDE
ncbi:MAG: hypothetical protein ACI85I_001721 [Arenicella sp.]|jgi:hypothetical protein